MMTDIEKQLAYHRHELNRCRLMGFHHSAGDVHREAIATLLKAQERGPVLSELQATHVAYWMCQRRSALKELITNRTKGITPEMTAGYIEWLIASVGDCQCDVRDSDWELVLEFLKSEGAAFGMCLPRVSSATTIINAIKESITCPA